MAGVRLRGVRKAYGALTVADGIDLVIEPGELVCLLGPSGCGKTTTLRLVAGFIAPDDGTIHVGDRQLSGPGFALPPEKRDMSMIFQSYALWPHMTVAENVAYGLTLRRLPKAEIARKVDAMLGVTQLQPLADRHPGELSGGQQQRVALARRTSGRAADPAAGRAAFEPRHQPARGDALRDPPAARRVPTTPRSTSPTTSWRR